MAFSFEHIIFLSIFSLSIPSNFIGRIEQSGQTISRGPVFLVLQIKEFLYSYLSIPDRMIGSLFYSTTGLHGAHATLGMPHFYLIPSMILSSSTTQSNSTERSAIIHVWVIFPVKC